MTTDNASESTRYWWARDEDTGHTDDACWVYGSEEQRVVAWTDTVADAERITAALNAYADREPTDG